MAPVVAFLAGCWIAWVDTRPTWDDTGITAGGVLLVALVLGALQPRIFWVTGLAAGLPVQALNAILHANYGSAVAIVIGLAGAGIGAAIGRSRVPVLPGGPDRARR